jgi:hypothetical protein
MSEKELLALTSFKELYKELFNNKFPDYAGKVSFTTHSANRLAERFDYKLNSQIGRAIIKAIKRLKKSNKRSVIGETYQASIVVLNSSESDDDTFVVKTIWNNADGNFWK